MLRVSLGWLWALSLLLAGLWLWRHGDAFANERLTRLGAVWALASGQFIFLAMVADDLCPRTPIVVSGGLKAISGLTAWVSLGLIAWEVWSAVR